MKFLFSILLVVLSTFLSLSQEEDLLVNKDSVSDHQVFLAAIKPSKAAFYSAILPGLGQAYNKKYWKVPTVYAAMAIPTGFFIYNNKEYQKYRELFRRKKVEEDYTDFSFSTLERAQKFHKKQRDLSMLVTIGVYVLQIVEASVDAHLQFHNTDNNLSFSPVILQDYTTGKTRIAAGLNYSF